MRFGMRSGLCRLGSLLEVFGFWFLAFGFFLGLLFVGLCGVGLFLKS